MGRFLIILTTLSTIGETLSLLTYAAGNISTLQEAQTNKWKNKLPCNPGTDVGHVDMFQVIPGGGWDNLRNLEMDRVVGTTYNQCRFSEDGIYLLPDSTYLLPIKQSKVESFAEIFDHWSNYTTTTSRTINADFSFFSIISGSFSDETTSVRSRQVNEKSATTRVQMRYKLYTAILRSSWSLDERFKNRVIHIGNLLENNAKSEARYQCELLVRDYGTHVITSFDVGAALVQIDSVKSTFFQTYSSDSVSVKAAASLNFFGKVKIGGGFSYAVDTTISESYNKSITSSQLTTHGGPPFGANFSLNDWESKLTNNLVAIDKRGDPLFYVIVPDLIKELPEPTVRMVAKMVKSVIRRYYYLNTITGCTSLDSQNFNYAANVDDGSCKAPFTNFTFGGVYQTCSMRAGSNNGDFCNELEQKNPLTGDYSCNVGGGYRAVFLNSGTVSKSSSGQECHESCSGWWIFRSCDQVCRTVYYSSTAEYTAYWCAATGPVQQDSGVLFGGLFTSSQTNPVTKTQACPIHYLSLKLGVDIQVCISDDYELGYRFSLPFGGFFSCRSGNPLAMSLPGNKANSGSRGKLVSFSLKQGESSWPQKCPVGFARHLAAVDEDCEVLYCVRENALSDHGLPPIITPPFYKRRTPPANITHTMVVIGPSQQVWYRMNSSQTKWTKVSFPLDYGSTGNKNLDNGIISLITIMATMIVGLVTLVAILGFKFKKMQKQRSANIPLLTFDAGPLNYGSYEELNRDKSHSGV